MKKIIHAILNPIRQARRKLRRAYYTAIVRYDAKSYIEPVKANGFCKVTRYTTLGKNVNMNGLEIVGKGDVYIGDNFHSGVDCKFITEFHNYQGVTLPYDQTMVTKSITIEENVWLGDRVMVLSGAHIGEGAIIQAGSVVVSSIPKGGIAGGHPAKVFKYRDMEHYERLKAAKAFC